MKKNLEENVEEFDETKQGGEQAVNVDDLKSEIMKSLLEEIMKLKENNESKEEIDEQPRRKTISSDLHNNAKRVHMELMKKMEEKSNKEKFSKSSTPQNDIGSMDMDDMVDALEEAKDIMSEAKESIKDFNLRENDIESFKSNLECLIDDLQSNLDDLSEYDYDDLQDEMADLKERLMDMDF